MAKTSEARFRQTKTDDGDECEPAWGAVHDALLPGWRVGPVTYDPGVRQWRVVTLSPQPGRRKPSATISGQGVDELAALRDLAERLSERRAVRL